MLKNIARRISFWGILAGAISAYLALLVLSAPFIFSLFTKAELMTAARPEFKDTYNHAIYSNPYVMTMLTLLGNIMCVFGGYIAAKIAKRSAQMNGMLSTLPITALSVYGIAADHPPGPVSLYIASIAAMPFFGSLGGALWAEGRQPTARTSAVSNQAAVVDDAFSTVPAHSVKQFLEHFAINLWSGMQALVFLNPPKKDWHVSLWQLGTLLLFLLFVNCDAEYFESGIGSLFHWHSLPWLYSIIGVIAAGALPAALAHRERALLLPVTLTSILLIYSFFISPLAWIFYDLGWMREARYSPLWHCYYFAVAGWLYVSLFVAGLRALKPLSRKALAALLLYIVVLALALHFFPPRGVWSRPPEHDKGPQLSEHDLDNSRMLEDGTIMQIEPGIFKKAVDAVKPTRHGRINMYFVGGALYGGQKVFMKEVQTVADLFDQNFATAGRSMVLINNIHTADTMPLATEANLREAVKDVGKRMDRDNDVLVLYLTSHGSKTAGLAMDLDPFEMNGLGPSEVKSMLDDAGIRWRIIIISGCYSGIFVPPLKNDHTFIATASDSDHTSNGCSDEGDMTDFPKAYIVDHLAKNRDFIASFDLAKQDIAEDEKKKTMVPSNPQMYVGKEMLKKLQAFRRQNDGHR